MAGTDFDADEPADVAAAAWRGGQREIRAELEAEHGPGRRA